jgi:D-alanyl-D-alanine dipeptidase
MSLVFLRRNSIALRFTFLAAFGFLILTTACAAGKPAADEPFIDILSLAPDVVLEIRYATANNFTGQPVYPEARCLLRRSVAQRLARVQQDLRRKKLGLKIWDCYRPLAVQKKFWELVPDPRYVADPKKGSRHNRGAAVDLTLITAQGTALEMPTDYDDFSKKAHRDYPGASAPARSNREVLQRAMARRGFDGLRTEWWHFDAKGWQVYPVMDTPLAAVSR